MKLESPSAEETDFFVEGRAPGPGGRKITNWWLVLPDEWPLSSGAVGQPVSLERSDRANAR